MNYSNLPIILGSGSKWRKLILQEAGFDFTVMVANIDERSIRDPDPKKLALMIAKAKAAALLPKIKKESLLITVDQVVVCCGKIFEKPLDEKEARSFIQNYSNSVAQTVTAVVVTNTLTKQQALDVDVVTIYFKEIPNRAIEELLSNSNIYECAGGFQIEELGGKLNPFVRKVDGDIDSVKGLPIKLLRKLI